MKEWGPWHTDAEDREPCIHVLYSTELTMKGMYRVLSYDAVWRGHIFHLEHIQKGKMNDLKKPGIKCTF